MKFTSQWLMIKFRWSLIMERYPTRPRFSSCSNHWFPSFCIDDKSDEISSSSSLLFFFYQWQNKTERHEYTATKSSFHPTWINTEKKMVYVYVFVSPFFFLCYNKKKLFLQKKKKKKAPRQCRPSSSTRFFLFMRAFI